MNPLAAATLASAALAIGAGVGLLAHALLFVFKPLTTVLIIAFAWRRGSDAPRARRWVLAGLLLSLAGDVALLWPQQGFLPGLVSFLLAHLAYLAAFCGVQRLAARPAAFAAYAVIAGAILARLWPGVPEALRIPVAAYVVFLAAMAAQAGVLWLAARGTARERRALTLALGGALFVVSDALLGTDKFLLPLPAASLAILATYWAAQWCIAAWLVPDN